MRRAPLLAAAFAALLAAPAAASGSPDAEAVEARTAAPPPSARATAGPPLTVAVTGGISDRGHMYADRGQRLVVSGRVNPHSAGQVAVIEVSHGGATVETIRTGVEPEADGSGRYAGEFVASRTGRYTVTVRVEDSEGSTVAGPEQDSATATAWSARRGNRGAKVRVLQKGLKSLGYVTTLRGRFDGATSRAVMAFRKVNGMSRRTNAPHAIYEKLFAGRGGFELKYPRAGKHVEFDKSRQVLVLARRGEPERIYHASSGKSSTPTVFGSFRFYRRQWGTNAKGMVHSSYFIRGYAIHGYKSVPPYPASHGCIRVPIPNSLSIAKWIRMGDRIYVYR